MCGITLERKDKNTVVQVWFCICAMKRLRYGQTQTHRTLFHFKSTFLNHYMKGRYFQFSITVCLAVDRW